MRFGTGVNDDMAFELAQAQIRGRGLCGYDQDAILPHRPRDHRRPFPSTRLLLKQSKHRHEVAKFSHVGARQTIEHALRGRTD